MKKLGVHKVLLFYILHPFTAIFQWRQSGYITRIMRVLGKSASTSFDEVLQSINQWADIEASEKEKQEKEKGLNELAILVLTGPATTYIAEAFELTEEKIKDYYGQLCKFGAGQWQGGWYVPVASLIEEPTLAFILKTLQNPPFAEGYNTWKYISGCLIEYYMYNQVGPVMNIHTGLPA